MDVTQRFFTRTILTGYYCLISLGEFRHERIKSSRKIGKLEDGEDLHERQSYYGCSVQIEETRWPFVSSVPAEKC